MKISKRSALMVLSVLSIFILFILPNPAYAHCPLCTVATGAVVAGARVIGIDDAVVGTFIGAFIVSTGFWTSKVINKRIKLGARMQNIINPYLLSIVFAAMTVASFYWSGLLGMMPEYMFIFGLERLLFGIVLGSVLSAVSFEFHRAVRSMHENRNYFPLQGIVLPLAALAGADGALYIAGII